MATGDHNHQLVDVGNCWTLELVFPGKYLIQSTLAPGEPGESHPVPTRGVIFW